jgi:hypothetical protein
VIEITGPGTARIEHADARTVFAYLAEIFAQYGVRDLESDVGSLRLCGRTGWNWLSFGQQVVGTVTPLPNGVLVAVTSKPTNQFYDWGRGRQQAADLIHNLAIKLQCTGEAGVAGGLGSWRAPFSKARALAVVFALLAIFLVFCAGAAVRVHPLLVWACFSASIGFIICALICAWNARQMPTRR